MRRESFQALWRLFALAPKPAKEMTESFSALVQLRPHMAVLPRCRVIHVGDGAHAARAEAIAVVGEAGIEQRLQDLQQGLLDEAVQHGGDAPLALAPSRLRDELLFDRLWLARAREELPSDPRPVLLEPVRQLIHRHRVDAGAALVLPHSLERGEHVGATQRPLHEAARS